MILHLKKTKRMAAKPTVILYSILSLFKWIADIVTFKYMKIICLYKYKRKLLPEQC